MGVVDALSLGFKEHVHLHHEIQFQVLSLSICLTLLLPNPISVLDFSAVSGVFSILKGQRFIEGTEQ